MITNRKTKASRANKQKKTAKQSKDLTAVGKLLRGLGKVGGTTLGGMVGAPISGGMVGNNLGAAISKWLGYGDYSVSSNTIVQKASTGIPMMHKDGQTVTIRHKEYIAQITGSQAFKIHDSYELNPGNRKTFPWLSTIASSFQEYRFKGVVFHYIPSSGNAVASTNAALGTVMMQTSYRSNDTAPTSKAELLNEYWAGETVPSETMVHPIECNPNENPFNVQYVRTEDIPDQDSPLLYDLGVTHIAVSGQQIDGATLGDLWVTYEVELKKPVVYSNVTSPIQVTSTTWTNPTSGSAIFSGVRVDRGNLSLTGDAAINKLTLGRGARGRFLLTVYVDSAVSFTAYSSASTAPTLTNLKTIPIGSSLADPSYRRTSITGATTVNGAALVLGIEVIDPSIDSTITFVALTITGAIGVTYVCLTPF